MKVNCANCNKILERAPFRAKKGNCYCNAKCQMNYEYHNNVRDKFKITKKANEYKRKITINKWLNGSPSTKIGKRGYRLVYLPSKGWAPEHIVEWQSVNGFIPKGLHIHHIDGDKLNNDLSNLCLLDSSTHQNVHHLRRLINVV